MSIVALFLGLGLFALVFWFISWLPAIPSIAKTFLYIGLGIVMVLWFLQAIGLIDSGSLNLRLPNSN